MDSLKRITIFNENVNQNVNFFNVDMVYTWQFAPGSFLNVVWKNAAFDFRILLKKIISKTSAIQWKLIRITILSLKVIYFLDYLQLKKKKTKN